LVSYVTLKNSNWTLTNHSLTITKSPRSNWNIGSGDVATAPSICPLTTYSGSLSNFEAGQYFKVTLTPNDVLSASGHLQRLQSSLGTNFRIDVLDTSGNQLQNLVNALVGSSVVQYQSSSFVNTQSTTTDYILRLRSVNYVLDVFDMTVTAGQPTLMVSPNPVTRAASATFSIQGAPGATVSNWKYSTPLYGTVSRTVNTGSSSWSGTVVTDGTASVTVVVGGKTYNLSPPLQVTPRPWTFTPPIAQEVANGTFFSLPSPPVSNGALGYFRGTDLNAFFTAPAISDNGPNQGFQYVTSNTDNGSYFQYEISPDLENTTSPFYVAQCGNYNAQTDTGFIAGGTLLSNDIEHESGTTLGHYQQFISANNDPANNLGVITESEVAAPGTTQASFVSQVTADSNAAIGRINTAASVEACNHDVRRDTSCTFGGYINFLPYQSCQ